jgi:hypothetical protein
MYGHREIVAMLEGAGASSTPDDVQTFLAAATAGDRETVDAMRAGNPTLVGRAIAREPGQLIRAAGSDSLERARDVNITRQGVVWLPVVAVGPGEQAVVRRIAEASLALYQDLLALSR